MTVEKFSDDVTKKVEALVLEVDACRSSCASELQRVTDGKKIAARKAKLAADIKKIEQQIHIVRGGRVAHHMGQGVIALPKP